MGRPRKDTNEKKVHLGGRVQPWLAQKARKHAKIPGNDNVSVQIEKALMYYHQWEAPK